MRSTRVFIACAAVAIALTSSVASAALLTTRDEWNGANADATLQFNLIAQSFDLPNSSTEVHLDSFTMVMRSSAGSTTVNGVFLELNASNQIISRTNLGSMVVTPSSPTPLPNDFQNVTFNVGQTLDVSKRYATAIWTTQLDDWADLGLNTSHSNPLFLNHMFWGNHLATSGGPTAIWRGDAVVDLNFARADVPEPSSFAIFGIGACVMGLAATRRRRRDKRLAA